jgi:hypothetical protein
MVPGNQLPWDSQPYKTMSTYYSAGQGFWILNGDAANLSPDDWEAWHLLKFEHSGADKSSYLTNVGPHQTLKVQRADQRWPGLLLPNIYHTANQPDVLEEGGLRGDLPIFLALIALSTTAPYTSAAIRTSFIGGSWIEHIYGVPCMLTATEPSL